MLLLRRDAFLGVLDIALHHVAGDALSITVNS